MSASRPERVDLEKDFSFSMNVAVFKESDANVAIPTMPSGQVEGAEAAEVASLYQRRDPPSVPNGAVNRIAYFPVRRRISWQWPRPTRAERPVRLVAVLPLTDSLTASANSEESSADHTAFTVTWAVIFQDSDIPLVSIAGSSTRSM